MVTAMAYPDAAKLRRKGSSVISSGKDKKDDPSEAHISKARYVLRNNFTPEGQQYPDRCLAVMAGTLALTEAYAKTQEDVKQREEEARIRQENLAKLGASYPGQLFSVHGLAFLPSWFPRPVGGT